MFKYGFESFLSIEYSDRESEVITSSIFFGAFTCWVEGDEDWIIVVVWGYSVLYKVIIDEDELPTRFLSFS